MTRHVLAFFDWLALVEVAAVDGDALCVQLAPDPPRPQPYTPEAARRYHYARVSRRGRVLRYVHRLAAALGCECVRVGLIEDADGTLYLSDAGRVIYRRSVTAERVAT